MPGRQRASVEPLPPDAIPAERLLTRVESAAFLRIRPNTLATWKHHGQGPTFYKIGQRVLYRQSELLDWLESRRNVRDHPAPPAPFPRRPSNVKPVSPKAGR